MVEYKIFALKVAQNATTIRNVLAMNAFSKVIDAIRNGNGELTGTIQATLTSFTAPNQNTTAAGLCINPEEINKLALEEVRINSDDYSRSVIVMTKEVSKGGSGKNAEDTYMPSGRLESGTTDDQQIAMWATQFLSEDGSLNPKNQNLLKYYVVAYCVPDCPESESSSSGQHRSCSSSSSSSSAGNTSMPHPVTATKQTKSKEKKDEVKVEVLSDALLFGDVEDTNSILAAKFTKGGSSNGAKIVLKVARSEFPLPTETLLERLRVMMSGDPSKHKINAKQFAKPGSLTMGMVHMLPVVICDELPKHFQTKSTTAKSSSSSLRYYQSEPGNLRCAFSSLYMFLILSYNADCEFCMLCILL